MQVKLTSHTATNTALFTHLVDFIFQNRFIIHFWFTNIYSFLRKWTLKQNHIQVTPTIYNITHKQHIQIIKALQGLCSVHYVLDNTVVVSLYIYRVLTNKFPSHHASTPYCAMDVLENKLNFSMWLCEFLL